jgi:mRNA interferase YafQ
MYSIEYTNKMKRDVKRILKRGKSISKLIATLDLLATGKPMPTQYNDHPLKGDLRDFRECHIENNWLKCRYRHFSHYADISVMPTNSSSERLPPGMLKISTITGGTTQGISAFISIH